MSLCFDLLIGQQLNFYFELKLQALVMTKAVSNREISSIKAVVLYCDHGQFLQIMRRKVLIAPPPPQILLGLKG